MSTIECNPPQLICFTLLFENYSRIIGVGKCSLLPRPVRFADPHTNNSPDLLSARACSLPAHSLEIPPRYGFNYGLLNTGTLKDSGPRPSYPHSFEPQQNVYPLWLTANVNAYPQLISLITSSLSEIQIRGCISFRFWPAVIIILYFYCGQKWSRPSWPQLSVPQI